MKTHRDDRARLDDHAFDDLGAGADEAVVLDDRGIRLQGLENAPQPDAARKMDVLADLCAGGDRDPRVDHRTGIDGSPDVDVARHQHDVRREVRAFAYDCMRHDAHAVGAQPRLIGGCVFERYLVVEARVAGIDDRVLADAEGKQNGLFEPLMGHPSAVALLGDAGFSAVEEVDRLIERARERVRHILRGELGAALERFIDGRLQGGQLGHTGALLTMKSRMRSAASMHCSTGGVSEMRTRRAPGLPQTPGRAR